MLLSLNWLKRHIDFDLSVDALSEILTAIGLEVEGVSTFESIQGGLRGVVCGFVKTCGQHPNADKLSVTTVDVGTDEDLNIVCGAPNVRAGQHVWVATIGTDLYTDEGEKFTIKKSKIRGEESHGMICAEDELGLGKSHDGIMILPESTPIGYKASDFYEVSIDTIYDIGLTPNRSDATCHRGAAEDLAAYFKVNGIDYTLKPLDDVDADLSGDSPVNVTKVDADRCHRYAGVCMDGLEIGDSPKWMQNLLKAIGVRPINNIVDITNFILHDMGQPLHAFDRAAISGDNIQVQTLPAGTTFVSLDEVERSLLATDLMICDGDGEPMCIGGVFGGLGSGVSDSTTQIFLESAHFDAKSIRVSSTKHNLRTDAAKVFEKHSDPNVCIPALKRAVALLKANAGAKLDGGLVDVINKTFDKLVIPVRISQINTVIGQQIGEENIVSILDALNMEPKKTSDDVIEVHVPTNKADVTREIDVIEEILRIYGFNNVDMSESISVPLIANKYPTKANLRDRLATTLAGIGFNEMMGMSLVESQKIAEDKRGNLVYVNNTSNIHLDIMRPSMLLSGLKSVGHNLNFQNNDLQLFELGRQYSLVDGEYIEQEKLTIFVSGNVKAQNWHQTNQAADYYYIKSVVEHLLHHTGVSGYRMSEISNDKGLQYGLSFNRGPMYICHFGKVAKDQLGAQGVKQDVYYAEFDIETMFRLFSQQKTVYTSISKFPTTSRDLAIVLAESANYTDVEAIVKKQAKAILQSVGLFDVYRSAENLGEGMKSYAINMVFGSNEKTLTDKEIDAAIAKIVKTLQKTLNATLRG